MDRLLLLRAYVRRRQWEAEQQAGAIWSLLAAALGKGGDDVQRVSPAALMRAMEAR